MTLKEAIKWVDVARTNYICDPNECGLEKGKEPCPMFHCDDIHDALDMAIATLEKQEKYKWHKCEKISDLPAANLTVHVREEDAIGNARYAHNIVCSLVDGTKAWAITGDYPAWKITHWRYIEPLEDNE